MSEKPNNAADRTKKQINLKNIAENVGKAATTAADNVGKAAVTVAGKTREIASKSQKAILSAIDQNGNCLMI